MNTTSKAPIKPVNSLICPPQAVKTYFSLFTYPFSLLSSPRLSNLPKLSKSTIYNLFMQNKAKFKKVKLNVNKEMTREYEQKDTWSSGKKQSQTNPNKAKFKKAEMNVTSIITVDYKNKPPIRAPKKQSQISKRQKPIQTSLPQGIMKKTAISGSDKTNPNKPNLSCVASGEAGSNPILSRRSLWRRRIKANFLRPAVALFPPIRTNFVLVCIFFISFAYAPAALAKVGAVREPPILLKSPDGKIVVKFGLKNIAGKQNHPVYSVSYKNLPIVVDSSLALAIKDAAPLEAGFEIVNVSKSSHDTTWHPVYGERNTIRDHYNQLIIDLKERSKPNRKLQLTFRAYNEGAAFRYTFPRQPALKDFVISAEKTQFRFLNDHTAWAVYSAQGRYSKVPLSKVRNNCERPTTIQIDDNIFAAVGEAALVDYARMRLSPAKDRQNTLVSSLASEVKAVAPFNTPWRFVLLGDTPGELLERNYLILNLNEPCAIKDTSWIKPGKVIREVTLTTTGGKACVDFAVRHNLQYVEYDAGWYGPEGSGQSDARTITLDPGRSKGPLDLHAVIDYAKQHGIGIILYVNRRALERQLDEILPLYEKWGIKGCKYGFVQVGSQTWTSWLHEAVRKAADHHLMVDIHDEYRPTGYSRTYPNLMTQEGIGGDETSPSNTQTLNILFNRMVAGAADNTICYYDGRVARNATHAYQLAKAVCFYSPWQFLYWYDRPQTSPPKAGGAGGSRGGIGNEPELEFFDHCPTVWDDTKVLYGSIGEYAVIARRSGDNWFIGCMNSGRSRTFKVPLDFLDADTKYTAHIYSDDPTVPTRTHVKIERLRIDSIKVLKAAVSAKGGQAIRIVPIH